MDDENRVEINMPNNEESYCSSLKKLVETSLLLGVTPSDELKEKFQALLHQEIILQLHYQNEIIKDIRKAAEKEHKDKVVQLTPKNK